MAAVVNSFPKDRDYRREAMQATPASFSSTSKYLRLKTHIIQLLCCTKGCLSEYSPLYWGNLKSDTGSP